MNSYRNIFYTKSLYVLGRSISICLLLFLLVFIQGCKSDKNEIQPNTTFKINFIDKNNKPIKNVTIFLFENKSDYSQSLWDLKGNGAKSFFSSSGNLTLNELVQGTFWVQCFATDTTDSSRPLRLNNNLGGFTINNNYTEAKNVELEILLQPSSGQVVFYTSSLSTLGFIQITINNKQLQGLLTASSLTAPSLDAKDGSVYTFSLPNNSFTYFAKSTDNCTWTGKVTIGSENITYVKLSPCRLGAVTFIGESGTNVFVGEDTEPGGIIPASGNLVLQLPEGVTYTWFAKNSTCAWSGTVLVNNNPTVTLPICN